jgi:hypothetical protein
MTPRNASTSAVNGNAWMKGWAKSGKFDDAKDALEALQAITIYQPALVIIERFFAASPRGAALISRIQQDPGLRHAEIRIA